MKTLKCILTLYLLLAGATVRADIPSTHGMLVFGGAASTYASHLPMFHSPHDYQAIFKITVMDATGSHAIEALAAAKAAGKTLFMLMPQLMDLTKVIDGTKADFLADLFDGHFERGGQDLGKVKIHVEKVILATRLNGQIPTPTPSGTPDAPVFVQPAQYLVFGGAGEYFAAHLIAARPSFDAIIEVSQPYSLFIRSCRTPICADPVKTPINDDKLPLTLNGPATTKALIQGDSQIPSLQLGGIFGGIVDGKNIIYVEEGDLL